MKNNKIVLMGNYGNHNNGDEAILLGAINLLTEEGIKKEDIIIISNNHIETFKQTGISSYPLISKKTNFKSINIIETIFNYIKVFKQSNKLIMGGGGVLMDLYKRDLPVYGTAILLSKLFNNKFLIYGVGSGPINTGLGKVITKFILQVADKITVRDELSKKVLNNFTDKNIEVIADLAFFMEKKEVRNSLADSSSQIKRNVVKIGITTLPYYSDTYWPEHDHKKYKAYLSNLSKSITNIAKDRNVEFYLFSTKFPEDVKSSQDLYALNPLNNIKIIHHELTAEELLTFMKDLDLVIGTRLHSLILSTIAKTPILAISYHKKVEGFMNKYNLSEYCFDINDNFERELVSTANLVLENDCINNLNKVNDQEKTKKSLREFLR